MKTKITLLFTTIFLITTIFSVSGQSYDQGTVKFMYADTEIVQSPGPAPLVFVSYQKQTPVKVHIQVRLLSSSGKVLQEKTVTKSKTGAFDFPFPSVTIPVGSGYRWHVQMYNSNWTKKLSEDLYRATVVVTGGAKPPTSNVFTSIDPPYSARIGQSELIIFEYEKKYEGKAFFQARLLSKSGKVIAESTTDDIEARNEIVIRVKIPTNISPRDDYQWNLQMYDRNWKTRLATKTKTGARVVANKTNLITKVSIASDDIQEEDLNAFTVSPNPFINSFEYEYSVEDYDDVTVDLYALNGRKIKTLKNKESHRPGNYNDVVDTSDLDAGIYILRINTSKGEKALKLIKN